MDRSTDRSDTTSTEQPETFVCCGVNIVAAGPDAAAAVLIDSRFGVPRGAHLCNSYTLSLAVRDPEYCALLNAADLNFADGHYVAMIGRGRGHAAMAQPARGPGLMLATIDRGRKQGLRHYLYGGAPETVEALAASLRERLPGVDIVGVESPPFRPLTSEEEAALVERVHQARPGIFWVGLGTPRQDHFVAEFTERLQCTVVPVGAAFDFHAGTKPEAPAFYQRHGLEWLYRFATEPRRLWKRYLIGNPVFLYGVLADRWRR